MPEHICNMIIELEIDTLVVYQLEEKFKYSFPWIGLMIGHRFFNVDSLCIYEDMIHASFYHALQ